MASDADFRMDHEDGIEPIAIIGMACRFPGEASSPTRLWEMMSNARTGHSKIPPSRFNTDAWYHPSHDRRGAINVKHGYFLSEDVSLFDAPFFSITAKEASGMDPMQRIMLEVAYESFENAGIAMGNLPGSKTSVYCGCFTGDFDLLSNHDIYDQAPNAATGTGRAMLSNRVSWFFDLRGPSFTIDTACSSSLYALHLACQSLRLGESKQALVSGANLVLHPNMMHSLTTMHFLSPDGICHSFDDRASGYARGEALGAIVLKPLKAALADGDTIRAVIRGSGANQDGKTPGITMPSPEAQSELIRTTYAEAGLPFTETGYFEAHGTGTGLGDPVELSAIGATFGAARSAEQTPLYVGSVKTNIGHTEGCSGLAGILKTVLCLEKGLLPPNAGFENLNPKLRLEDWKLALPTTTMPWPTSGLRRASVNSFGYGGANAHVILDDAYHYLSNHNLSGNHNTAVDCDSESDSGISVGASTPGRDSETLQSSRNKLFVLSSQDQGGLQRISQSYHNHLDERFNPKKDSATHEEFDNFRYVDNLAYTLASHRTNFDYRSFAVADSMSALCSKLEKGLPKLKRISKHENMIFVFTGQGAQWPSMGNQLLKDKVFQASMLETQTYLRSYGCVWDVFEELEKTDDSRIDLPQFSQPICTALQIALVDLLNHWGVKPKATVGHSSGEIGAAYAAGTMSHEDAIKIAYFRGVYSADVPQRLHDRSGTMMAAGLSESEARQYLSQVPEGSATVACINSPSSVTFSGDETSITHLETLLNQDKKFARKLRVQTAYHSQHMQVIAEDYLSSMGTIKTLPGTSTPVLMFSSVTGKIVNPTELDASYWVRNMVNPVRFSDAVQSILSHSLNARGRRKAPINWSAMIEVGPHEALKGPLNQIMTEVDSKLPSSVMYTSLLRRGQDADITIMEAAGHLWSSGHSVDLSKVNQQEAMMSLKILADLPAYSWNHQKGFWHEPPMTTAKRFRKEPRTDLLGVPLDIQNTLEPRWRNFLRIPENPWMEHHEITGTVLYPGAGILIMVIEAARQLADPSLTLKGIELQDVTFDRGLVIPAADQAVETSLSVRPHKTIPFLYHFTVFSLPPGGSWTEHSSGLFSIVYTTGPEEMESVSEAANEWKAQTATFEEIKRLSIKKIDTTQFYKDLQAIGMGYGPLFTNMVEAAAAPGHHCGFGTIIVPDTKSIMPHQFEYPHLIHPATLDAIFHLLFVGFAEGNALKEAAVPVTMDRMFVAASLPEGAGAKYVGYTEAVNIGEREAAGNLVMSDEAWTQPKIIIRNFAAREVSSGAMSVGSLSDTSLGSPKRCARLQWKEDIDYLSIATARKLLLQESRLVQPNESDGSNDADASLGVWLDRACHKDAELKVLVVGSTVSSGLLDLIRRFAPRSGRRFRFAQCCVTQHSQQALDAVKQALSLDQLTITYQILDLQEDPQENGYDAGSYDLILSDTRPHSDLAFGKAVSSLRPLLRLGGMLALAGPKLDGIHGEIGWHATLETAGFEKLLVYIENEATTTVIASVGIQSQLNPDYDEIILLERPEHSNALLSMKEKLWKHLVSKGFRVRTASLSRDEDFQGKAVVSLLEVEEPLVINWTAEELENFIRLVSSAAYVMWITRGGQMVNSTSLEYAPATGLLRTVRTEVPQIILPHLDLSPTIDLTATETAELIAAVFQLSLRESSKNNEMEFVETDGRIMIPRVIEDHSFDRELELHSAEVRPMLATLQQDGRQLKLEMGSIGTSDSLRWVNDEAAKEPLPDDEVELHTTAVSLNASDVQAVMGQGTATIIGQEAVGVVTRVGTKVSRFRPGQTVVVLKAHACRTQIRQHQSLVQEIPDTATVNVAATFPTVFTTAYHALLDVARLRKGESILILAAAGGLGQAAIQIAQFVGAEVFVTVGSGDKADFLLKNYSIAADHVFDSRSTNFAAGVARLTGNRGVDVVISSSSGVTLNKACSCIADFGRFIDISKKVDVAELTTALFRRNVSFTSINMEHMANTKTEMMGELLQKTFDLIRLGVVGEIFPTTTYSVSDTQKAFELMKIGDHSGKIVLTLDAGAMVPMLPAKPPPLKLDPEATYVLSGGLGGLGPSIAETMYEAGARRLAFLSRSGASTAEQQRLLAGFQARGCIAEAFKCDISDATQVEQFMEACREKDWRVRGLVQCAMVLRDSVLDNMTFDKWSGATQPKIAGTWNLHSALPNDLEFFVILSSVVSVIGNTGQANYAAGNSYQDALAHYRRMRGLAATSLNVGLVSDASHFNSDSGIDDFLEKYAHLAAVQVSEKELNIALAASMRGTTADGVPVPAQLIVGISDGLQREGRVTSLWPKDRKFDHRVQESTESGGGTNKNELKEAVAGAKSLQEAAKAVENALKGNLASAMTASPEDVDVDKPLTAFGIDSLKAVEVRNWVFREIKSDISVFEILSPISLAKLSAKMAAKSKLLSAEVVKQAAEDALEE